MSKLCQKRIEEFIFMRRRHFAEQARDSNQGLADFRPDFDSGFASELFVVKVSELGR